MTCDGHFVQTPDGAVSPECRCAPATTQNGGTNEKLKLAHFRALCEVASPGPWCMKDFSPYLPVKILAARSSLAVSAPEIAGEVFVDAEFITASRECVPLLFARLDEGDRLLVEACRMFNATVSARDVEIERLQNELDNAISESEEAGADDESVQADLQSQITFLEKDVEHWMTRAEVAEHERDAALVEVQRVRDLIDRDRTGLAAALNEVIRYLSAYAWIPSGEWGSYNESERTERALRKEIGWCHDAVEKVAREALQESGRRAHQAFHAQSEAKAAHDAEEKT